jgi:hypothetical protein
MPARERVEQDRHRLYSHHGGERGEDQQAVRARAEPAVRKREQRVHEHGEDQIRRQDADRVRDGVVGVVKGAEQRREADGGEQQPEPNVRRPAERDQGGSDEREADQDAERSMSRRVRRVAADGRRVDRCGGRGEREDAETGDEPGRRRGPRAIP